MIIWGWIFKIVKIEGAIWRRQENVEVLNGTFSKTFVLGGRIWIMPLVHACNCSRAKGQTNQSARLWTVKRRSSIPEDRSDLPTHKYISLARQGYQGRGPYLVSRLQEALYSPDRNLTWWVSSRKRFYSAFHYFSGIVCWKSTPSRKLFSITLSRGM